MGNNYGESITGFVWAWDIYIYIYIQFLPRRLFVEKLDELILQSLRNAN